ncbi:hypothetical protein [Chroogloeocystis siderophila]|nr:hypothetical protein [Chroogloeocystis siderophila]
MDFYPLDYIQFALERSHDTFDIKNRKVASRISTWKDLTNLS